jgi:hypothetical protein
MISRSWGDEFVLKTLDGTVLASEKESKRVFAWNRSAEFRDPQGRVTGYLAEDKIGDLFSPGYVFHFLDANGNEVGKSQKIGRSAIDWHQIRDAQGNVDYEVDNILEWPWEGDHYDLEVRDTSDIPLEQAILLVCVEDAIKDAHVDKD